jgi:hypothetical protein
MSNIQNQKSGLAKLMATENLIVQHAKVPTAMFDPKNRVLTCPIWEQMSGDLYDLLMGHEVGHAIDTPADGWHGAVHERGANYKGFLNVVEDARIEKRQKRRYPGLRRSFINGFNELMAKDFFGLAGRGINTMPFIDRLNIYTKSGYTLDISFNTKEQDFVDRVQACETWDDVLKVTNEIWDYSKEEQSQTNIPQDNFEYDENGEEAETESGSNEGDAETDGQGKKEAKSKNKDGDGDQEKESSSGVNQDGEEEGDVGEDKDGVNRIKTSQSVNQDQSSEPRCETDENFRDNEGKLIAKKAREYVYIDIPTPNLKKIVTPAKRVQEVLTEEFSKQRPSDYQSIANTLYNDFRRKNERFISLLAKEFEMRKAADKFSKAKTSSTGDIDVSRVFKYQIDDNIFKKVMRVPKGKSHGLILLLDKSGSMSENLCASYEQILVLATFCRKVNIPFAAYGFGNADHVRVSIDFKEEPGNGHSYDCFTENHREMKLSSVYLREMINSKMSNSEFSKATKNILCLMNAWSGGRYSNGSSFYRPSSDSLSNTPLTEAMIACQSIIKEFRTVNNLDIVNLCVVHDGDADDINSYHNIEDNPANRNVSINRNFFSANYQNIFLCDKKNKIQQEVSEGEDGVRIAISKWLAKTTGVKIIGFYLSLNYNMKNALRRRLFNDEINELRKAPRENYFELKETYSKYMRLIRKDKFLESKNSGYESFFILPGGGDLSIEDEDFEAPSKVTTSTLTKAFSKYTKNRQVNRVLVSRFISMIAV